MSAANDDVLKARFGRVVHCEDGPYIGRNGVSIELILSLVDEGLADEQICKRIPDLEKKDVLASKAYRVRFLENALNGAYPSQSQDPYFVLDENISYLLLPEVFRLYGRSTSVLAEGLYFQRNSDEHDVWKFAVDHGYKAILTQDSDFRGIAKRHRAELSRQFNEASLPKVIMIPHGLNVEGMAKVLEQNRDLVHEVVSGDHPYATCRLYNNGMATLDHDEPELVAA